MKKTQTELAYLRAAAQSATATGLVILLYDLLISDLERAAAAIADGDIEKRSAEIRHAFLILQQLEGSLDKENGGQAAIHFSRFYSVLRCRILEAQIKASREILQEQIRLIFEVRKAWQQVDTPTQPHSLADRGLATSRAGMEQARAAAASGNGNGVRSNWTA
jgi:flagellar protein FliS